MEKAKAAVSDFMSKSGHHDTTVHERVNPAVKHETVKPSKHEKVTTAVDKEIHQDHYHTAVQPVQDREVLPEQHHHNLAGVEHRRFDHGDDHEVQQRLKQEAAQFKDESVRQEEHRTRTSAPQVAGEHVHHHVHETIQPVVQKETIEPHVVHTTVPIHEVHHNTAQHHSTSALPAVSMDEFRRQGGSLTGREERYDGFEGEPRNIGGASDTILGSSGSGTTSATPGALHGDHNITGDYGRGTGDNYNRGGTTASTAGGDYGRHGETGHHGSSALGTGTVAGATAAATGAAASHSHGQHDAKNRDSGIGGTHFERGSTGTTGTGTAGAGATGTGMGGAPHRSAQHSTGAGRGAGAGGLMGSGVGAGSGKGMGSGGREESAQVKEERKPSLLDKLNPMKDSDHDGKAGFMD